MNADQPFALLGLAPELLNAVADLGFTAPTAVQAQAIPLALHDPEAQTQNDLMVSSQTGSGKQVLERFPEGIQRGQGSFIRDRQDARPGRQKVLALISCPGQPGTGVPAARRHSSAPQKGTTAWFAYGRRRTGTSPSRST